MSEYEYFLFPQQVRNMNLARDLAKMCQRMSANLRKEHGYSAEESDRIALEYMLEIIENYDISYVDEEEGAAA